MDFEMEEQVRHRAYEIWECEGRPNGRSMEHWDQAMRELTAVISAPVIAATAEKPVEAVVPAKAKARVSKAKTPVKAQRKSTKLGQVTLN